MTSSARSFAWCAWHLTAASVTIWLLEGFIPVTLLRGGVTAAGLPAQPGSFFATGLPDECLRPLRDSDGEDETLHVAKPDHQLEPA